MKIINFMQCRCIVYAAMPSSYRVDPVSHRARRYAKDGSCTFNEEDKAKHLICAEVRSSPWRGWNAWAQYKESENTTSISYFLEKIGVDTAENEPEVEV